MKIIKFTPYVYLSMLMLYAIHLRSDNRIKIMTGGVGFSRQGSDSFKQNRDLRNKRSSMKENPYSSFNKNERSGTADYDELINYHKIKSKRESRRKILTWTFILTTLLVSLLIIMFTK